MAPLGSQRRIRPPWLFQEPNLDLMIEGSLGKGGMGQVFRARDTRLGREVAIKVWNARFSDRFEREARAISALNHPHICTLYDVAPIIW